MVPVLVPAAAKNAERWDCPMAVFTVTKKLGTGVMTAIVQMMATLSNMIETIH